MNEYVLLKQLKEAQKIYKDHFLNKEFLYIYEENNEIKSFYLTFYTTNFKHLTGIKFKNLSIQSKAENFYRALEDERLNLKNLQVTDFTKIKLKHFSKLPQILYSPSLYYAFDPKQGNTNWLYIDSFISEKKVKMESVLLGITKKENKGYAPSSLLYGKPYEIGKLKGNVLLIGSREYSLDRNKYNTIFRVSNIEKIPNEIKSEFKNLENYNCLTGNIIPKFQHRNGENRWIAKADIKKYNIKINPDAKEKTAQISHIEEGKLYIKPITYYNLSDLQVTKELEKLFKPMKEIVPEKRLEKEQEMEIDL